MQKRHSRPMWYKSAAASRPLRKEYVRFSTLIERRLQSLHRERAAAAVRSLQADQVELADNWTPGEF